MMNICLLGNWHSLSNAAQYADVLEEFGHVITRVGAPFTVEDAERWGDGLLEMAWKPTAKEVYAYINRVLEESPKPEIITGKGERISYKVLPTKTDLLLSFYAYGETPIVTDLHEWPALIITAGIYGDTHTGHLTEQVADSQQFQHCFVQFRHSDAYAFAAPRGPRVHWLPAAVEPRIWALPTQPEKYPLLFVGSTHPAVHQQRIRWLQQIADALGPHQLVVKHAFGTDAAELYSQARVILNHSLAGDLNMRVMEALASGVPLLTDAVNGLDTLGIRLGKECYTYRNFDETLKALNRLQSPARAAAIGDAGRGVAVSQHTYQHRCQQLLTTVFTPTKEANDEV